MYQTMQSAKFLVTAPLILAFLFVVNLVTSPGDWWVQWAALGLGVAWVISLIRVVRAALIVGGLSALGIYLWRRREHDRAGATAQGSAADADRRVDPAP